MEPNRGGINSVILAGRQIDKQLDRRQAGEAGRRGRRRERRLRQTASEVAQDAAQLTERCRRYLAAENAGSRTQMPARLIHKKIVGSKKSEIDKLTKKYIQWAGVLIELE